MAKSNKPLDNIERLRLFWLVACEGSFTRAAAVAGLPQSGVSRQISKLEAECGARLFLRTGRGVELSDFGARMLADVDALLSKIDQIHQELPRLATSPVGTVRLAMIPSLYLRVAIPLFVRLRESFPDIRLNVQEGSGGQIDQWLATGAVDIGLGYRYGHAIKVECENLCSVSSYLASAPGVEMTSDDTVAFSSLDGLPLVLPCAPSAVRVLLDQCATRAGIQLNVVMEADSTRIQRAAAMYAGVFTIIPKHAIFSQIESGNIQASRIVNPTLERFISLSVTTTRPTSRAGREVCNSIRNIFSEAGDSFS